MKKKRNNLIPYCIVLILIVIIFCQLYHPKKRIMMHIDNLQEFRCDITNKKIILPKNSSATFIKNRNKYEHYLVGEYLVGYISKNSMKFHCFQMKGKILALKMEDPPILYILDNDTSKFILKKLDLWFREHFYQRPQKV